MVEFAADLFAPKINGCRNGFNTSPNVLLPEVNSSVSISDIQDRRKAVNLDVCFKSHLVPH